MQVNFADNAKQADGKIQYDEFFGSFLCSGQAATHQISDSFSSAAVIAQPGEHVNTLRQIYVVTRHGTYTNGWTFRT